MTRVKPFRGVRPPATLVEEVECRPYDVLTSEEARIEAGSNEKSYDSGAEQFKKFLDKGWLKQDEKENYYLYAQTMSGKTQYGFVLCAHVDDYWNGIIKKHELTRLSF